MILVIQLLLLFFSAAAKAQQHGFSDSRAPQPCLNLTPSPYLEKFVDRLPRMPIISLLRTPYIRMGAYSIYQRLHRDLPPTRLYAFGTSPRTAIYPGPTLVARQGVRSTVRWENYIRDYEHMLPLDRSLHWANPRLGYVPVTIHNHGAEVEGWADGHPEAWFTVTGEHGRTYVTQDYVYPNDQLPTMLWYHDHTLGITRLNVAAGLVGAYVIEPSEPEPVWVPRDYHVLVIQDKAFYEDGSIKYPTVGFDPEVHPQWCVEYLGDVVLVNGVAWPFMEVEPSVYRFRAVNAGNARTFNLVMTGDRNVSFVKIGTDGALLRWPIEQPELRIGPAERADWLFDFRGFEPGQEIELRNTAPAPFPFGTPANQSVMLFRIVRRASDRGSLVFVPPPLTPDYLATLSPVDMHRVTIGTDLSRERWLELFNRRLVQNFTELAHFQDDMFMYSDPPREIIRLYSTEIWTFINFVPAAHLMHLHLVNFLTLAQQPFDPDRVENGTCSFRFSFPDPRSCYSDYPQRPDVDQLGHKDTVVSLPFFATTIHVRFVPNLMTRYRIDPTVFPGYVHHCHLLEHEDNEMMRQMLMTRGPSYYANYSFPYVPDALLFAANGTRRW